MSIASPLFLVNSPQSLELPPGLTNLNTTSGAGLGGGWPDHPFAVPIATPDPDDDCYLWFPMIGDRLGTNSDNHFFILEVLEQLVNLKAQPAGSVPEAFDVGRYDIRFKMELVPQHSMSLDLAMASLQIMYKIVLDSEVREFRALVVCQGLALGRFRTWFLEPEIESGTLPSNSTSSERGRIF